MSRMSPLSLRYLPRLRLFLVDWISCSIMRAIIVRQKVLKRLSLLSGRACLTPIFIRHFCVRKRRLKSWKRSSQWEVVLLTMRRFLHWRRASILRHTRRRNMLLPGWPRPFPLDCRKFNIACGQINIGNAETTLSNRMRKGVYQADGAIKAEDMMNVADVAAAIQMMAQLPVTTNVLEITIMANNMPYVGRG